MLAALYFVLLRRQLTAPTGDVRSGLFSVLAEWAGMQVKLSQGTAARAWKPSIMLPVEDPDRLRGTFELVKDLASPMGSIKLLGLAPPEQLDNLGKRLEGSRNALLDATGSSCLFTQDSGDESALA